MHNYVNGRPTESQRGSNEGVIHDALENEVYTVFFSAMELEDGMWGFSPVYTLPSSDDAPTCWVISDSQLRGVHGVSRRHKEWRDGFFKIRIHYSVSDDTGNVYWRYGVGRYSPGEDMSVTYIQEAVSVPSSTKGIWVHEFNNADLALASEVNDLHNTVMVSVGRNGADALDTNAGDVSLFGVELVYVEKRRMVGGMHR